MEVIRRLKKPQKVARQTGRQTDGHRNLEIKLAKFADSVKTSLLTKTFFGKYVFCHRFFLLLYLSCIVKVMTVSSKIMNKKKKHLISPEIFFFTKLGISLAF